MSGMLLEVENLCIDFATREGVIRVLDDISFSLRRGERIGLVGESGCGKSMTALALMGLLPAVARISQGRILFRGEDLAQASASRLRLLRGNEISMIFQEPMTSLNPVFTIGSQIGEVLRQHQKLSPAEARERAIELLDSVKIPHPSRRVDDYPFQLSGGQCQRVMIAIALACSPELLIADEPTTALDVTVQAQIFDLLYDLSEDAGTAIVFISHDMGAVAMMTQRLMVMYAGRKVEEGEGPEVIAHPAHPYTDRLIHCVPHVHGDLAALPQELPEIPGIVPSISDFGRNACLFAPRCHRATEQCRRARPEERTVRGGHRASCWNMKDAAT